MTTAEALRHPAVRDALDRIAGGDFSNPRADEPRGAALEATLELFRPLDCLDVDLSYRQVRQLLRRRAAHDPEHAEAYAKAARILGRQRSYYKRVPTFFELTVRRTTLPRARPLARARTSVTGASSRSPRRSRSSSSRDGPARPTDDDDLARESGYLGVLRGAT